MVEHIRIGIANYNGPEDKAAAPVEEDENIIGKLREEITIKAPSSRVLSPEEYEAPIKAREELHREAYREELNIPEFSEIELNDVREYTKNLPAEEPRDYSYFLTETPRHKWQWLLLLPVRLVLQIAVLAKKIDDTGELWGGILLFFMAAAIIIMLCVL